MVLIEDEDQTLEELGVCDEDQIIIEIRNKDLTWPEEIGSLSINSGDKCKQCKYLLPYFTWMQAHKFTLFKFICTTTTRETCHFQYGR